MNVSRLTERYVYLRPNVTECLRLGLVNYSSLARQISEFYELSSSDAAFAASRRLAAKLNADKSTVQNELTSNEEALELADDSKKNLEDDNVSRLTQAYVSEREAIKECLLQGLLNHAALARQISNQHALADKDEAICAALRRFVAKRKRSGKREGDPFQYLRRAALQLTTRTTLYTVASELSPARQEAIKQALGAGFGPSILKVSNGKSTVVASASSQSRIDAILSDTACEKEEELVFVQMMINSTPLETEEISAILSRLFKIEEIHPLYEHYSKTVCSFVIHRDDLEDTIELLHTL